MTRSYFDLEAPVDLTGWTTLSTLSTDRLVLKAKVAATQAAVGCADTRVAASIDFLGVAARVVAPPVQWAVAGRVPELQSSRIWWHPADPGPMRLAMDVVSWHDPSAEALLAYAIGPTMRPLVEAYRDQFALSPQVLWGNVASGLNGACISLGAGAKLSRQVLALGELAGTARSLPPRFRRNSCCLFYRLPGTGFCGDCVLRRDGSSVAARR